MTTEEALFHKFGPLLTLTQVAEILDRSPDGLRFTIRTNNPLGRSLRDSRVKIGRRVHFKAKAIAALVDGVTEGGWQ